MYEILRAHGNRPNLAFPLNFGVVVLSMVELKLNRCTPIDRFPLRRLRSESLSRQSSVVSRQSTYILASTSTAIPGDLLAMVWGSVSYGKKYSEGYPKIFVTVVATAVASELLLGMGTYGA